MEADRHVVGIAIRVRGGFKFFASDHAFIEAEGAVFPRPSAMARRIAEIARRRDAMGERADTPTRLH